MWSSQYEYREPKNDDNSQFSCMFAFEKTSFETDDFQRKAMDLLLDGTYYSKRMKELFPTDENKARESMCEVKSRFRKNFCIGAIEYKHYISSPFSPANNGYFDIVGDNKPRSGKPHKFFKKQGYRSVEFTNQISFEKIKDYDYVQALIAFFKKIFTTLKPVFGYLDRYDYVYSMKQKDPRQYVYGLTFYGKEMVEQIGRETLLNAPVYRVEEFDHGGIMLQIHENPLSYIKWPCRNRIIKHLGLKKKKHGKPGAGTEVNPRTLPGWLTTAKPPVDVRIAGKKETMVVVGLNADELEVKEECSLFSYFKQRFPGNSKEKIPAEFAFASWFSRLDTGLEAFVSGNMFKNTFKVFVGEKVCGLEGFKTRFQKVDPGQLRSTQERVSTKFRELGFREKAMINFLDYHMEGN